VSRCRRRRCRRGSSSSSSWAKHKEALVRLFACNLHGRVALPLEYQYSTIRKTTKIQERKNHTK